MTGPGAPRGMAEGGALFDLSGKVALVTGAARGIGLGIAGALARQGAAVVLSDKDGDGCARAAAALGECGLRAMAIACDVTDRPALERMVEQVQAVHGRIDILVCNAGIAGHNGPIATATDADWDATMTVNLRSILWLTGLVVPGMAARRDGSVVIVSSIAGLRGNKSIGLYGLSKAATAQLARNLAVEWGPSNVRVNAIAPGFIRTDLSAALLADAPFMERRMALTPLRRPGEVEEVAGLAVLLASPSGAFITGQTIVVDGGTTISDGN